MISKGLPAVQCCFQAVSSSSEAQKLRDCPFLVLGKNAHVVLGSLLSGDSCNSNRGSCWDVCRLTNTAFSLKPKQQSASLPGRFLLALHPPAPLAPCCHFSGLVHLCLICLCRQHCLYLHIYNSPVSHPGGGCGVPSDRCQSPLPKYCEGMPFSTYRTVKRNL